MCRNVDLNIISILIISQHGVMNDLTQQLYVDIKQERREYQALRDTINEQLEADLG